MLRYLKRIVLFLSLFLLGFVVKEFLGLYTFFEQLHPFAGYGYLVLCGIALYYFILVPAYKLLTIRVSPAPTTDPTREMAIIKHRLRAYKRTHEHAIDISTEEQTRDAYQKALVVLDKEVVQIRKKYVIRVFYGTGIVQNGFIDAFIILSSNVSMIREIFETYNGRMTIRDLMRIGRQVYYSIAIGGSEAVEYGVEELFSKLATRGVQSIPFLEKITSSVADGYINAVLTTRVALITQNYCTKTLIKSQKELYPSASILVKTTQSITSGMIDNIMAAVQSERTTDFLLKAANPVGYVFEQAIDKTFPDKEDSNLKENLKKGAAFIGNPIIFGIDRWVKRARINRQKEL